jgi:hypothetical protein
MVIPALGFPAQDAAGPSFVLSAHPGAGDRMKLLSVLRVAVAALALSCQAPAVFAAPTCQDKDGLTIRCGTQGAMPVGWRLPFEERKFESDEATTGAVLHVIAIVGLLFALIALIPEFDGRRGGDWGKQEGDG